MPRVHVPDGPDLIHWRLLDEHQPAYKQPWTDMKEAVTHHSILPWRLKEMLRYRAGQISGCLLCQAARMPGGAEHDFTEATYAEVATSATSKRFSEAEKLAIEYYERFVLDHHSLDDEFFERMRGHFSEAEIVDITFTAARHMAFSRFTHVLALDDSCELELAQAPMAAE